MITNRKLVVTFLLSIRLVDDNDGRGDGDDTDDDDVSDAVSDSNFTDTEVCFIFRRFIPYRFQWWWMNQTFFYLSDRSIIMIDSLSGGNNIAVFFLVFSL